MNSLFREKYTFLYWGILLLNASLFLIWPLAHTIALRKLLLLLSAIAGIVLLVRSKERREILSQPWLVLLGVLLAWVTFHAAFLSQNGAQAWKEYLGQWIPAYLALFAGIGVGLASTKVNNNKFGWMLLTCALALPIVYLLGSLIKWMQLGYLPVGYMSPSEPNDVRVGTDLKMSLVFSLEMMVSFSSVKLLEYWEKIGKFSLRSVWVLPIILAIAVAIISLIKNFILLLTLNVVLILLVQGFRNGVLNAYRLIAGVMSVIMFVVLLVNISNSANQIWQHALSDTRISLDIDNYQNWENFVERGLPKNEFGETLSETYYLRLAYAHAGLRASLETPWGYGVTRKAFEKIEQKKIPDAYLSSTHNGYLNMSCAIGLPGLFLFLLSMTWVVIRLNQSNSKWSRPAMWMIGIYLVHWAVDPVERDHFFELFLFMISLMLTLVLVDNKKYEQV